MKRNQLKTMNGEGGFTLIEIMAALAIFMIGVMGMVALQGASIHAATKSRQQTAAVGIARYIITGLKAEFAAWDRTNTSTGFPSNTYPLLSTIFAEDEETDRWVQFGGNDNRGGELRLDDLLGHSGLADGSASRFCINYQAEPLETLPNSPSAWDYNVWLVRVRVSWTKDGFFQTGDVDWNVCDPESVEARIVDIGSDDVVELVSTATREFAK